MKYKFFKTSLLTLLTSTAFAEYQCPSNNLECSETKKFLETFATDEATRTGEIGVKLASAAGESTSTPTVRILLDPPKQVKKAMMGMGKATTQDNPQPTPEALDGALLEAAGNGNVEAIRVILSYEAVKNTQAGINASYKKAVKAQKLDAAQAILDNSSIQPNTAGVNETLTTVVQLRKSNDAKRQMIEFIYNASVKPTKAHTQIVYDLIIATANLQELGEWFANLVQGAGIELTVATAANDSSSDQSTDAANGEDASLTNEDKALIEACTNFNKNNVKNAIIGKASQLTQPGLNKALMKILTSTDPNYMHYSDFMGCFRKGQLQFSQETADAILMFAAITEQTNLLLQFDKRVGYIDRMYTPQAMDQAILKIVEKGNDQLLRAFTSDLASTYPKATENGLKAAFKKAKQLNTRNTCPKGRIDGCMDTVISYLRTYGRGLGIALS